MATMKEWFAEQNSEGGSEAGRGSAKQQKRKKENPAKYQRIDSKQSC
jgi:hypothetical protein